MKYTVIERPAKSFGSRFGNNPKVVVLHHTGGSGNVENEVRYLQDNPPGVSIHVCIAKDGTRYRMVDDKYAAYHVGYSKVGSIGKGANQVSLGIELINTGSKTKRDLWPDEQVESCAEQVVQWMKAYNIEMVTSHGGIDTRGKFDPYLFPWNRFWGYVGRIMYQNTNISFLD